MPIHSSLQDLLVNLRMVMRDDDKFDLSCNTSRLSLFLLKDFVIH